MTPARRVGLEWERRDGTPVTERSSEAAVTVVAARAAGLDCELFAGANPAR